MSSSSLESEWWINTLLDIDYNNMSIHRKLKNLKMVRMKDEQ